MCRKGFSDKDKALFYIHKTYGGTHGSGSLQRPIIIQQLCEYQMFLTIGQFREELRPIRKGYFLIFAG